MARIQPGDTAPDFTLLDSSGTSHNLRDAITRGPVVLIFYVLDNTPG